MTPEPVAIPGLPLEQAVPLAEITTFQVGGPCRALIRCRSAEETLRAVQLLKKHGVAFVLTGFGSNILAADDGVAAVVVRFCAEAPLIRRDGSILSVDAGTSLDDLTAFAVRSGLDGLTLFSGIPGTTGGAIAGNAGAYGAQISDHLLDLRLLMPDGRECTIPRNSLSFSYRDSELKHNGCIILSARFDLPPGDPRAMQQERDRIIAERGGKHGSWTTTPCAGSFFRNVEPTSRAGARQAAGWFLEQAGAHLLRCGGAHPYDRHANIVTRDPEGTAQDVYDLTLRMHALVKEKFGVDLQREVRLLGTFRNGQGNPAGYW